VKAVNTCQETRYRCFIKPENCRHAYRRVLLVEYSSLRFRGMAIAEGLMAIGITNSKEFLIVLNRMLAIMLTGMMLTMAVGFRPATAQSVQDAKQEDPRIAKARIEVWKMGVGETVRVEVKLRDHSTLKGYIGEATNDSFTVVDSKSGSSQRIAYADVEKVKKAGGGFSTRSWIILGAAAAGAAATWMIVKPVVCDGGAQSRGPC
jgi:hypothetical protein